MNVSTIDGTLTPFDGRANAMERLRAEVEQLCGGGFPIRLAVTASDARRWHCEIEHVATSGPRRMPPIFAFRPRRGERTAAFNAVMLVPTGIDCAIGGHAGDATPAARLLAQVCDQLIVHPNVVNASDINEQPANCLYVEGSVICRLLMGGIALQQVRANRLLVVTEDRPDSNWVVDQVVNSTSAVRATLGAHCPKVVVLRQPLSMRMGKSTSGRAVGEISGFDGLLDVLEAERGDYDAVALATKITPSGEIGDLFQSYFRGEGPNPWGGVEAALTHVVSTALGVQSAHAPTLEDLSLRTQSLGQVDPRKSAEAISTAYLFCALKGLHRAPAIVPDLERAGVYEPGVIGAEDVSCLVVPDGCLGLPLLAALAQGIPVIAVRNNTNLMRNDLAQLPFRAGQLLYAENYLEAAGLIAAMRAGVSPASVLRPLRPTVVEMR